MKYVHNAKPEFAPFETWAACARCNARVPYSSLKRERMTGLLVCSETSGRPVAYCWDPWHPSLDFQVFPDKSIEPPPEAMPLRYNLDDIWGAGNKPVSAPDDATRTEALMLVPYYKTTEISVGSPVFATPLQTQVDLLNYINPVDYIGTFLPSSSLRTVTPPNEIAELNAIGRDSETGARLWPEFPIATTPVTRGSGPLLTTDTGEPLLTLDGIQVWWK